MICLLYVRTIALEDEPDVRDHTPACNTLVNVQLLVE